MRGIIFRLLRGLICAMFVWQDRLEDMRSFSLLALVQVEIGEKENGRQEGTTTKLASQFFSFFFSIPSSHVSLSPDQSVFIMIARDLLSFGLAAGAFALL